MLYHYLPANQKMKPEPGSQKNDHWRISFRPEYIPLNWIYMMKRSQDTRDYVKRAPSGVQKSHQIPVAGVFYMLDRRLECIE